MQMVMDSGPVIDAVVDTVLPATESGNYLFVIVVLLGILIGVVLSLKFL